MSDRSAGGFGRGARILSVGIAATGLVTFAYFALANRALGDDEYGRITLVWSVMFVVASVLYRPIEQLLSRTIAERRAHGLARGHPLRVPLLIQTGFAVAFLVAALALRGPLQDGLLDGSAALYWILVVGVLAYAASYFARGFLAGSQRFDLYGGLVLLEASARVLFALAAAVGLVAGQSVVAVGMAAAPLLSLVVVPLAFSRAAGRAPDARAQPAPTTSGGPGDLTMRAGGGFALSVLGVMLAEQALINAAVLSAGAIAADTAVAGLVFNALLIARVPLQLFQAVQGSLLPHLAGLQASTNRAAFTRAIRVTLLAIAGFAVLVTAGLLALGPWAMDLLFPGDDQPFAYPRAGLALVGVGMGCLLAAGTLN
ncbi:MAG: hypothetical protein H0U79_00265, partial [Solirubrobacterales bacterium]|nr:hypothetical protein [Solirubrobacterales bacterium]